MHIGIIGAMPEEVAILREDMANLVCEEIASRAYYSGMLYGKKTTLVFSRWGKVAAAIAATTLITKYRVNALIFVGVAGAISDQLNIGDVVIANQLYQHDMDARPFFKEFEIPLTGLTLIDTDLQLSAAAQKAASHFCTNEVKKVISPEVLQAFFIAQPHCHHGIIASGDCFVASNTHKTELETKMPGVLAVEMEGAAVAQVCFEHNIPFTVIRTISDKADHSAHIDFPKFISQVAKFYSRDIVKSMYKD